jgi:hypothetical protein
MFGFVPRAISTAHSRAAFEDGGKLRYVSRAQRSTSRAFTPVFAGYGDALQTPISGLPEIGAQMRASRVNPTCVDRRGP